MKNTQLLALQHILPTTFFFLWDTMFLQVGPSFDLKTALVLRRMEQGAELLRDFGPYWCDSIIHLQQTCCHIYDANLTFHIIKIVLYQIEIWFEYSGLIFVKWHFILLEVAIRRWVHCVCIHVHVRTCAQQVFSIQYSLFEEKFDTRYNWEFSE